ncbi:MAG: hypothetical protein NT149_03360 [Candidatus Gottesmanbacteria bacterium]|nr:hypothetical protein [Candidatus Gottesmanbacteria bacterium]
MKNKTYLFIFGSIILILLGVALVAIIGKAVPAGSSSDIRARAGTQNALEFVGVVASVDEGKGTISVTGVQLADTSRSGDAQNLGDWTVTAPPAFNFASISQGMTVTIGVEASTFDIASHAVMATTLTPGN